LVITNRPQVAGSGWSVEPAGDQAYYSGWAGLTDQDNRSVNPANALFFPLALQEAPKRN
jgi:hypothetical protein